MKPSKFNKNFNKYLESISDTSIRKTLDLYQKNVSKYHNFGDDTQLKSINFDVLDTSQINKTFHEINKTFPERIGLSRSSEFLSCLIQKSYDEGNNNFELDVQNLEMNSLASNLNGTKDNLINIKINGNGGRSCGFRSNYISMIIDGDVEDLGDNSKNSEFRVEGVARGLVATESTNSTYELNEASYLGIRSYMCDFSTSNPKTLKKIKKEIPLSKRIFSKNKIKYTGTQNSADLIKNIKKYINRNKENKKQIEIIKSYERSTPEELILSHDDESVKYALALEKNDHFNDYSSKQNGFDDSFGQFLYYKERTKNKIESLYGKSIRGLIGVQGALLGGNVGYNMMPDSNTGLKVLGTMIGAGIGSKSLKYIIAAPFISFYKLNKSWDAMKEGLKLKSKFEIDRASEIDNKYN